MVDELGQGLAVEALPRDDVGEDAQGTRLHEPVALGVGVLVVGRDARVAQDVAHAGGADQGEGAVKRAPQCVVSRV